MSLEAVVPCSGGMHVAQRGSRLSGQQHGLHVGPTAEVVPPAGSAQLARRADRSVWRRSWSLPDRLVIEYVGSATVEVHDRTGEVTFDRRLPLDVEQHLLLDHVLPLHLARRGALVLHGALISRRGAGVVLVGASGAGKSTLAARAWSAGWTVGGDDGTVIVGLEPPEAEPTYASVRVTPDSAALLGLHPGTASSVAGKLRMAEGPGRQLSRERVPVVAITVVAPSAQTRATFRPLAGVDAHAALLGATFTARPPAEVMTDVVDRLGALAEACAVGVLAVPRGAAGLDHAEAVLCGLVEAADR